MQLVVAEKPSVARDLARVLGVRPTGQHWFESDAWLITWCIGHLVELEEPATYDPAWKPWRLDALPMLPAEFKLRPSRHAAPHLRAIRDLFRDRRFSQVVNACDAGREGELIFRYVYQYARGTVPVRRLWISSLTDDAIRRGFAALRPAAQLDPLGDAARSRSEADWLVGMNATRAVTVHNRSAGHTALYSIGRVQTPTLAMLVTREQEIRAFVPRDYWEIRGDFTTADHCRFAATWRHGPSARLATAALADAIAVRDRADRAIVESVHGKTVREPPPMLFDLTSLQRTANKRWGFTAARTLELAQALYERHKMLTYPRTDSRHLSSDLAGELPALFAALATIPDYAPFAQPLVATTPRPSRRVFDDGKVHDHHAIIPTGAIRSDLDRDEQRVFDLVARRFLGAFHPDAEFAITEAWVRVGAPLGSPPKPEGDTNLVTTLPPPPDRYFARGRVRVVAGWQDVAGIDDRTRDGGDEPIATLPVLAPGQPLDGRYAPIAKKTTPPHRYTEATLLGAMESAGKAIDDDALRLAMKDCGLGTPATRAAIIETLLKRDYIVRDRKELVPTAMGIGLVEALPVASLASPELTGAWEARLARIARGEDTRAAFMTDIARYVAGLVAAIRSSTPSPPPADQPPPPTFTRDKRGRTRMRKGGAKRAWSRSGAKTPRAPRPTSSSSSPSPSHLSPVSVSVSPSSSRPVASSREASAIASRSSSTWSSKSGESSRADASSRDASPTTSTTTRSSPMSSSKSGASSRDASPTTSIATWSSPMSSSKSGESSPPAVPSRDASPIASITTRSSPVTASGSPRTPTTHPAVALDLVCPKCRSGALIAGSRGWGCSHWKSGCAFVVWFETCGRRLTAAQLRDLVTRGKTRKAQFVDRGVPIAGRLVLDAAGGAVRLEPA